MADSNESSGVDELIARLRAEGVEEGKTQANALMDQARSRAEQHLTDARREADEILRRANESAEQTRRAGEEAVQLAMRDAILRLKAELVERFGDRVRRLVTQQLEDESFLQQLVMEIARRSAPAADQPATVLLPEDVVGLEQLRREPEDLKEGTLSHFVATVTKDLLREGLQISVSPEHTAGIRIRLEDEGLQIDVTDRAVSDLLLRHLVPRFRAIMEGIIQ